MKIKLSLALFVAALMAMLTPQVAHADLGYWSATLIGKWRHSESGMVYQFKSNATYSLVVPNPGNSRIIAETGWWKIAQPTEKESGGSQEEPVALITKMRKVTFLEPHGLLHTESIVSDSRSILDFLGNDGSKKSDLVSINSMKWKRIK